MVEPEDDDSFMDWETRNESIPMTKHIIAGRLYGVLESSSTASALNM